MHDSHLYQKPRQAMGNRKNKSTKGIWWGKAIGYAISDHSSHAAIQIRKTAHKISSLWHQYICSGQCSLSNMTSILLHRTEIQLKAGIFCLSTTWRLSQICSGLSKDQAWKLSQWPAHLILIVFIHSNSQCWQGWVGPRKEKNTLIFNKHLPD